MEIVTQGRYYEGDWTTVYTVAAGNTAAGNTASVLKVQNVLSAGCGA